MYLSKLINGNVLEDAVPISKLVKYLVRRTYAKVRHLPENRITGRDIHLHTGFGGIVETPQRGIDRPSSRGRSKFLPQYQRSMFAGAGGKQPGPRADTARISRVECCAERAKLSLAWLPCGAFAPLPPARLRRAPTSSEGNSARWAGFAATRRGGEVPLSRRRPPSPCRA